MSETRTPRPAAQYGPTSATVAENVQRLRKCRSLSIYQLSAQLRAAGRPITPSAVGKIERQQRQVTVDDLTAIAAILGVSPSALLLPLTDDPGSKVEITGVGPIAADDAWDWVDGRRRLDRPCSDLGAAELEFALYSRPPIRRDREIERGEA